MVVDKESTESVGEDALCTACEMAVVWMKSQLNNEGIKDRVIDYVNQVTILTCYIYIYILFFFVEVKKSWFKLLF